MSETRIAPRIEAEELPAPRLEAPLILPEPPERTRWSTPGAGRQLARSF